MFDSIELDAIQDAALTLAPELSPPPFEMDIPISMSDAEIPAITIGSPDLLDCEWQIAPDNCAVEAERSIINTFLKHPLSQEDAMYISASNGWYQPGFGTSPEVIGQMMDLHGIPNHTVMDASVADLANELAQGHGVIVGVDSDELWDQGLLAELKQWISETFGIDFGDVGANHAIVVTGIDVSDPSNPMVIINDSGVPNGQGQPYPLEKFLQSWEDSGFYYTATDVALPSENIHGTTDDMGLVLANLAENIGIGDIAGIAVGDFNDIFAYTLSDDIGASISFGTEVAPGTAGFVDNIFADDEFIASL